MKTYVSLFALLLVAAGCTSAPPGDEMSSESPATPAWRVIEQGSYGRAANAEPGTSTRTRVGLARTETEYRSLWSEIVSAERQPPPVDFSREVAVILTLGQKSTGGWGIEVDGVAVSGPSAEVRTRVNRPAPGGIVTMAFTAPFAVVAIAEPAVAEVVWVDETGEEVSRNAKDRS